MLLLSLCGLPPTLSQNMFGEPRLVGPHSIQCVEDSTKSVTPLLIDSYWSNDTQNQGLNDYVQLLVNVSVSYGTISFSNLRNIKFYTSTNANEEASNYALIGKRQWMVPAMKSMMYSANSALPASAIDTINMTIQQQISKMGEWTVEHDYVQWITIVDILPKTTLPSLAVPSSLSTTAGVAVEIQGLNVTWETGSSSDSLLLTTSVSNGALSMESGSNTGNDECIYDSNTYKSTCSTYTNYGNINTIINSMTFIPNNASLWSEFGIIEVMVTIDVINATHTAYHNENVTLPGSTVTSSVPIAVYASNSAPTVSVGNSPSIVTNELVVMNSITER